MYSTRTRSTARPNVGRLYIMYPTYINTRTRPQCGDGYDGKTAIKPRASCFFFFFTTRPKRYTTQRCNTRLLFRYRLVENRKFPREVIICGERIHDEIILSYRYDDVRSYSCTHDTYVRALCVLWIMIIRYVHWSIFGRCIITNYKYTSRRERFTRHVYVLHVGTPVQIVSRRRRWWWDLRASGRCARRPCFVFSDSNFISA